MTPYDEQKKAVRIIRDGPDRPLATKKTWADIHASIERAQFLDRILAEIKECAQRSGAACVHCSSIANLIAETE